ncbi:hypothetical protein [Methanohalophilus sp.]
MSITADEVLKNSPFAYAYHRIILDEDGKPVDYEFLDVNSAFEKTIGLEKQQILNKRATYILPAITESKINWISVYGNVALTGEENSFV